MQHLSLHWLKDRVCKAKHGAFFFFDDCELLDPEPNRGDGLNTLIQTQEANVRVVLLVSMEAYSEVQDRVASCVHLEEITPTLTFFPHCLEEELYGGGLEMFSIVLQHSDLLS